jgi:hypothetical protein
MPRPSPVREKQVVQTNKPCEDIFYKKDLNLSILGPVGDVVSEWIIKGAFIKTSNFGSYDWSNQDAITIEIGIGMDYCILNY